MALFSYVGRRSATSERVKGQLEAVSLAEATKKVRELGLMPLRVESGTAKKGWHWSRKKVGAKDRIIFTRQLAVMTKAGLPMIKALEALGRQLENRYFTKVIGEIIAEVKGGRMISQAMTKYPKIFPEVYVAVISAGEQTGQLSEVLFSLADQQEKEADLVTKVKSAMIYPSVILVSMVFVMGIIIFFVLPSLQSIFADLGGQLPLATRLLFGISNGLRHYILIIVPVFIALIYLVRLGISRPAGRLIYDRYRLRIPILGPLTVKVYMARFSRTMAMLSHATLPILQALQIVQKTLNNHWFDLAFARVEKAVESGQGLARALENEPLFPPMVSELVSLGEESGNLESVLMELARFYDSEVDTTSKNLSSLIEPLMLIIMGIGVAFIVSSVLSPIYKLVNQF